MMANKKSVQVGADGWAWVVGDEVLLDGRLRNK